MRDRDNFVSLAEMASHLSMRVPVSSSLALNEKVIISVMAEHFTQNSAETTASIEQSVQPVMSRRTIAALKMSILVMTVLIIAGVIALVIGIKRTADMLMPLSDAVIELPAGARITGLSSDEGGVWLLVTEKEGKQSLRRLDEATKLSATIRVVTD